MSSERTTPESNCQKFGSYEFIFSLCLLVRISFKKIITFGGYVRMGPWELDTHKFEVLKCVASNNL